MPALVIPANAVIHIDLVGTARAWTAASGEVGADTLLGTDPNTQNGWYLSGYDPNNVTADGYVATDAVLALIGSARAKVLAGATIRVQSKSIDPVSGLSIAAMSADGNDGVEFDALSSNGQVRALSYRGPLNNTLDGVVPSAVGLTKAIAATLTGNRADVSANGSVTLAGNLADADRPVANPLVAVVVDGGYPNTSAIQTITIYEPPNLSALSAVV